MTADKLNIIATTDAVVFDRHGNLLDRHGHVVPHMPSLDDVLNAKGIYHAECRDADGTLIWEDEARNTVVTTGKNYMLNSTMAASSLTVVGPYLGLISSVSFTAISASDTMSSHSGWTEAGGTNAPTYTSPRPTAAFASASAGSISLSAAASFAITGTGTLEGMFVVLGSGAVSTIDNTAGTLFSAGLFTGGTQAVVNTNTVNVTYSLSV